MSDIVTDFPSKTREIPKVLLPMEYALGWRESRLTNSLAYNTPIAFDRFEKNEGTAITQGAVDGNGNFSQIHLEGGKVYKLTGFLVFVSSNQDIVKNLKWYNVNTGDFAGSVGYSGGSAVSQSQGGSSPAIAYIDLSDNSIFELRITGSNADSFYMEYGTSFNIETLQNLSI